MDLKAKTFRGNVSDAVDPKAPISIGVQSSASFSLLKSRSPAIALQNRLTAEFEAPDREQLGRTANFKNVSIALAYGLCLWAVGFLLYSQL